MTEQTWEIGQRAIVNGQPCTWRRSGPGIHPAWHRDGGGAIHDSDVASVYPLLTLDPNNLDEALSTAYLEAHCKRTGDRTRSGTIIQPFRLDVLAEAIRSLLPPPVEPAIPEPNGRGAYVTDAEDRDWERRFGGTYWYRVTNNGQPWCAIPQPVTVHFHGVGCTCAGPGCPGAA